jgi:hypothetical protein
MKFLCLIFAERMVEDMSKSEAEGIFADCAAFTSDLSSRGHYIGGHRLLPPSTATTLRMHKGQIALTDGPFAETKEQLGGYYLIEARDMNEAIRIAARSPGARIGCVEVRPVAEDLPSLQALDPVAERAA